MLRHNLLLIYRNFKRFKSTFFINLIGLSTGLACALLIFLWIRDELRVDKFHKRDSQLYLVMYHQAFSEGVITSDKTPGPLSKALAAEIPEIQHAVTTSWIEPYTLSVEDENLKARGIYASEDYFNIFSYDLIQGDRNQVLKDLSSIVISESLSRKLFSTTEDVIGKMVKFEQEALYQVTGVFEDVPSNSSRQFDFVLSFEAFEKRNPWTLDWNASGPYTYVIINETADIRLVNEKILDFATKRREEGAAIDLFLKPYSENYLYGHYAGGRQAGGRIEYVRLFSVIAIFILVIACINFMNLSTAKATRKLKEIGIKKAIGAGRKALISQYLGESILMAFLSLITAILLVALLLHPFNELTGKQLVLHFDASLAASVFGITLITGMVAGSYPALYLSGFDPVKVLKGKLTTSTGEVWARKGMVVFQFSISVILIVSVMVVFKQIEFVQNIHLGYEKDNVIYFKKEGSLTEKPETFLSEVRSMPGIISASSMGHNLLEHTMGTGGLEWEGKHPDDKIHFEYMFADYEMMETLGMEMLEGRMFSRAFTSDSTAIILNKAAVEFMGIGDPIGKRIRLGGDEREIIGVVKNFHFASLREDIKPLFLTLAPNLTWHIVARIDRERQKEVLNRLEALYVAYNPGFALDYRFLDEDYQALYTAEQRVSTLSRYFAGLAILISCLGLFGLAAFTAERRRKEIGIRKVMGASEWKIMELLSGDFAKMVLLAIAIALPISFYMTQNWLDNFAYKIDPEWWYFIGAGLLTMLVALATVSFQSIRAALANPVESLRSE
ncbi:ABC transporter permease [Negadavirga shengliensis]|uniref:ABC transporter permease n=1 Tax=Negadavirga shengliensis TaxID=1389218 RepID=A0ABV9T864_9BACT